MDPYAFCLVLGLSGLVAMALLGLAHGVGDSHHGHAGGTHGAPSILQHAVPRGVRHHVHVGQGRSAGGFGRALWCLASPRVAFSVLFGFGATGLLLGHALASWLVVVLALLGAFIFERWLVQPVWRFVAGFASTPARTLETALLEEARAETNFDARGHGLVSLKLDGQVVQTLATLEREDNPFRRVRAGDRLMVVAINPQRNSCTVRLLS